MSKATSFWLARGGEAVAGAALYVALAGPTVQLPARATVTAGITAGFAMAFVVARVRPRPGSRTVERGILGLAALYLAGRAAVEETFWRLGVTGLVAEAAGWPTGLAAGSSGFALAHARAGRSAVSVHALTGLVFGGLFLATGSLAAPFLAHAAYNLVTLGIRARPAAAG